MAPFIPSARPANVRKLTTTDEQLASVFNQSWQGLIDYLQYNANNVAQLTQQIASISDNVTTIENNYNSQLTALEDAQSAASPILATSTLRNSNVNTLNSSNSSATSKIAAANTALTTANTNLTSVQNNSQPFDSFLNAIAALNRPINSMFGTNLAGSAVLFSSSGQSFTIEMASARLDRASAVDGGGLATGAFSTVPLNTEGFINTRNQFGLEEVNLDTTTGAIVVPCTGGNCLYYVFSLSSFCGIGGGNSKITLNGATVALGTTVQSISGRSNAAEDFNQTSAAFGAFAVTTNSPELRIEAIAQAVHPNQASAALGRSVGGGVERYSSLLLFRRRIL
jgi:hypothetical protein